MSLIDGIIDTMALLFLLLLSTINIPSTKIHMSNEDQIPAAPASKANNKDFQKL